MNEAMLTEIRQKKKKKKKKETAKYLDCNFIRINPDKKDFSA